MTVKAEHEQEFLNYAANTARTVHENEPDTILHVLHKHPTEPYTYVWVERYAMLRLWRDTRTTPILPKP
jgi:quinol monooxygenase YgiN